MTNQFSTAALSKLLATGMHKIHYTNWTFP